MDSDAVSSKRITNEYDPLTNWRISSNFNSSSHDSLSGSCETTSADRDRTLSASSSKKQKRSRFAKAILTSSHEDEKEEEVTEDAVLSSTSLVSESSSKSATVEYQLQPAEVKREKYDVDRHQSSVISKRTASSKNDKPHSDDVEIISAKSPNHRHAFGSKLNPLVVQSPDDDDDELGVQCVKRQMRIEDYFGAKFTSLHNMLATNMTSNSAKPSSSKSSGVVSPVRTSAKIPLAKSALLGNMRDPVPSLNFMRQKPHAPSHFSTKPVVSAAKYTSPGDAGSSNAVRRVAHQPTNRSVERTPIMLTSSCRIPYTVRQHQLSLLVDSCLLEFRNDDHITTADIFEKCREEEKTLAETVMSPLAYKNRLRMLLLQIKKNHAFGVVPAVAATTSSSPTNRSSAPAPQDALFADAAVVYKLLQPYLLNTEQLIELGFPYFVNEKARTNGIATSSTAKTNEAIAGNGLKLKRICCRCNLPFELTDKGKYVTKSQCIYHSKSAFSRRQPGQGFVQRYLCCDDSIESAGCATCKYHVSNEYPTMRGFVETKHDDHQRDDADADGNKRVFSVDCEMLYTAGGVEVAKVTVVNHLLEVVYDSFIIPEHQIIDLNTRFSGLKREDFDDATKDLAEVQRDLIEVFGTDSILIGHSLQSDLLSLKMVHRKCVDTSMVWPHRRGAPFKRALRNLMREILQIIIQEDEAGHDSKEDAAACMRLMLHKIKQDFKKRRS